ncbi:transcription intermediary factor 1-beta-like [Sycon ciliatum]|uniref:transcription intermediary factor 1-beta-like n=1 Tax=Sycon ciliatum TaxID=27933 RepID=UPI0031F6E6B7
MANDLEVHNAIGKDVSNLRCCVACHSDADSLKMKVLNCLHAMCVTCLRQHLSNDGTVSCFKCLTVAASGMPGVRLEESLADWPVQKVEVRGKASSELQSYHSEKQLVCQSLECQGESSPATSLCVDCGLYMCEGHEKVHLMKRSCYGHHLQSVHTMRTAAEGDTVPDSEFLHCSLHPHFLAKSYCKKCEQLICQRCSEQRHASCSPSIEEIPTAAERKRSQWKSLLSDSSDSWREHLSDMNVHIATRTAEINEKVEALSEKIVADFNMHIKNLQRRQEDLLNELDARRWNALQDLEKQSGIVEKKTFQLDCCEHLVQNLGNSNLLTAEKILQTQIKDVVTSNEEADISDDHRVDVDFTVSYRAFATDDQEKKRTSQLGRFVDSAFRTESVKKNTYMWSEKLFAYCANVNKVAELTVMCNIYSPEVICLCETWLSPANLFSLAGYTVHRRDRPTSNIRSANPTRGYGGVAILVKDGSFTSVKPLANLQQPGLEAIWLELRTANSPQRPLVVCATYRPPGGTLADIQA